MKLQTKTKEKIDKLNKMLGAGEEKEIINQLFNRNKKKYGEYIEKYKDHIIKVGKDQPTKEIDIITKDNTDIQIFNNEDLVKMKDLLKNYEAIKDLLSPASGNSDIIDTLTIDSDVLNDTDLKTTTFRISKKQLKRFDKITKKNKGHLKAQVFNQMIKEFCDRYE
jgi:hypothetical protein